MSPLVWDHVGGPVVPFCTKKPFSLDKGCLLVKVESLIEVLVAGHLTSYVETPFPQRGGIFIVAPPAALKSTFIKTALDPFPNSLVMSDINVRTMMQLRDDFCSNRYTTLAFTAFEKIYQRQEVTSSNIEGHISAMVEEGFRRGSFEDQRMILLEAHAFVVGGMIPALYRRKFTEWMESGFARRFLWCHYNLQNPDLVVDAIHQWKLLELTNLAISGLPPGKIPFDVTESESSHIRSSLKFQPGRETPFVLMKKILSVLKWRYRRKAKTPKEREDADRKANLTLRDFGRSLGQKGDNLII